MRKAAWVLTAVSGVLWGLAGASTWGDVDPRAVVIEAAAAVAAVGLAGLFWVAWAVRDRDKDALVRAMADFSQQRASRATAPLRRVS